MKIETFKHLNLITTNSQTTTLPGYLFFRTDV